MATKNGFKGNIVSNKRNRVVRDGGVSAESLKQVPKEYLVDEEEEVIVDLTFEESLQVFQDQVITPPQGCLIIVAPIPEKRTKTGLWIPKDVMNDQQKKAAFLKWHRVLAVADNIPGIKAGDEVWVNSDKAISTIGVITVGQTRYIKIDYYVIDGIRPYKESNYETTK